MELVSWSVEPELGSLFAVNDPDEQEQLYRTIPQTIVVSGEVRRQQFDDGSAFAEFDWEANSRSFSLGDGNINLGAKGETTTFRFTFENGGVLPDPRADPDGQTVRLQFDADSGIGRERIAGRTLQFEELTEPLEALIDLECSISPQEVRTGGEVTFSARVTNRHQASVQGRIVWREATTGAELARTQFSLERVGGNNSTQVTTREPLTTSQAPQGSQQVDPEMSLETAFFAPFTGNARARAGTLGRVRSRSRAPIGADTRH